MRGAASSTAVMARRAAAQVEGDSAAEALFRTLDFYPTPPWAARAGAELLSEIDPETRLVWEPACGAGHMASPLAERFQVIATDVYPHGYGDLLDFFSEGPFPDCDWIVTNPPFKTGQDFVRLGLSRVRRGVALLLRLAFLESIDRYPLLYGAEPLSVLSPFAERVPMTLGRWDPGQSSATAYAWFFWRKGHHGPSIIRPIPPGTKSRLSRADDASRFGWRTESPLLDAMEAAE
jgi:hypothetical protein